jgi:hypothetical protein
MTLTELVAEIERRMDGPHADEDTAAAAWLAAEAVRYLNYASDSHSGTGLEFPSTVYSIAGGLSTAAYRMQQLCEQLARYLTSQDAAGLLGTDDGTPPYRTVAAAKERLNTIVKLAAGLDHELSELQNTLAILNGRGPNRPGTAAIS